MRKVLSVCLLLFVCCFGLFAYVSIYEVSDSLYVDIGSDDGAEDHVSIYYDKGDSSATMYMMVDGKTALFFNSQVRVITPDAKGFGYTSSYFPYFIDVPINCVRPMLSDLLLGWIDSIVFRGTGDEASISYQTPRIYLKLSDDKKALVQKYLDSMR